MRAYAPVPFDVAGPPLQLTTHVTVAPLIGGVPDAVLRTIPLMSAVLAARYGPTNGPPSPTGDAPEGMTLSVDVSPTARDRFSRPLPVSSAVPAASAFRA